VRMQGSEVSGESVEQTLGDPAAKCVPRDEGYSVAATRKRRPRLARQPVDFKHEGVWLADAQRREAGVPHPLGDARSAIGAGATCLNTMAWSGGFE
jgi:hypothetical protein